MYARTSERRKFKSFFIRKTKSKKRKPPPTGFHVQQRTTPTVKGSTRGKQSGRGEHDFSCQKKRAKERSAVKRSQVTEASTKTAQKGKKPSKTTLQGREKTKGG